MAPWLAAAPSILIAAGVVLLPGLAVTSAAGARGIHRWALAAPATFTLAGVSAILLETLSISFTPLSFGAVTIAVACVAYAARALLARAGRTPSRTLGDQPTGIKTADPPLGLRITLTVGLALSTVMIGARLMAGIGSPTAVAQLFDNAFHLNAVAIINSTGNGSSMRLGNLTEASQTFYPAAFHDVAAIVMGLGIDDVSVVLNAVSLVISAVVWPLSLLFLATRVYGMRPSVLVATGVIAASFSAFPYRMLSFGVLYPFHSAVAMLPVVIALVIELFGMARTRPIPAWAAIAALAATAPGIALAHPSAIIAALVFAAPFVIGRIVVEFTDRRSAEGRGITLLLAAVYLVGTLVCFLTIRPPLSSAPWEPSQTYQEAIGSIVTFSPAPGAIAWGLFAVGLLGLIAGARQATVLWPVVTLFALGGILYFASAAAGNEAIRDLFTGVWYRDTERISALFMVAAFLVVLAGALSLYEATYALTNRFGPRWRSSSTFALGITTIVLLLLTQRGPIPQAQEWLHQSFGQTGVQSLITDDERELMSAVREHVPADGVVVGNPFTGAALTPAFADRRALAPHVFGVRTADEQFLLDHWDEAGTEPHVCEVVRDLGAFWALDFGGSGVLGGTQDQLPGTDSLASGQAPGIVELDRIGDAALYEATVCDPPSH